MSRRTRKRRKKFTQIIPELIVVYRYFWSDMRQKLGLILTSFVALFFGVCFRLLEPWPLKFVLDEVFAKPGEFQNARTISLPENWSAQTVLVVVAVAVIVIAALRAAADYKSKVGFFQVGNFVVIKVRERIYRHLQCLPMAFHDRARHGDLISRVTRDVSLLRDVTATAILPLLGSVMVLIGMALVMILLNWQLAAVSLIIMPLYWLTTVRLGRRIRESARKQRQRESAMAAIASESLGAIRAIKTLGLESKFAADFGRKNNQSQTDDLKSSRLSLQLGRTVDILLAISTAGVLWLGAGYVLAGTMLPGDLVVFLVYLKRSFKPAQEFAKYTARIAKATAAGERVIQILDRPVEADSGELNPGQQVKGELEFRNVCFGYDQRQLILKKFNLRIQPGQTLAIMGASGVGKSTLLGLLLRLYNPQSGEILIDGEDVRNFSLAGLRASFSMVLQNPLLFSGTIRENILLGKPADEAAVIRAAKLAQVDEFAIQMPNGYDTEIGERATQLSRGQRQRIAIARAALGNNAVLLLDEPTTGLDKSNQRVVAESLLELARDKTTLLITHDFSIAQCADEIVFLNSGQVVERGTHADLIKFSGEYAQAYLAQDRMVEALN